MRKRFIAWCVLVLVLMSTSFVFAASPSPHVTIVNPGHESTLYSDNLLISVKLTQSATVKVSVWQLTKVVNSTSAAITLEEYQKSLLPESKIEVEKTAFTTLEAFTSTNNLSFYTKKIENVNPGLYTISVDTLDEDGKVLNTNASTVVMEAKDKNPADPVTFETQQSGTSQFLKGLLKSIFGN